MRHQWPSRQSSDPVARSDRADFVEFRRTRDRRKRDRLVEENVKLARTLAWRYAGRGAEIDDLIQVALYALVQAVDRFDPARGVAFSTYATPTIVGALKRHFRDRAWAIRPPRSIQERYLAVNAAREQLVGLLRRSPTMTEIAEYGGWSEEQVQDALTAHDYRYTSDLNVTWDNASNDRVSHDEGLDWVEDRMLIDDLMQQLGAREREIVRMRFFGEMSQEAIGTRVGVSQMHVSRLLRRSLDTLRASAQTLDLVENSTLRGIA